MVKLSLIPYNRVRCTLQNQMATLNTNNKKEGQKYTIYINKRVLVEFSTHTYSSGAFCTLGKRRVDTG